MYKAGVAAFNLFTVNSGVSLYFVHGRLSFYYFKILTNFTCKRIRANVDIIRNLCGSKFIFLYSKYFKTFHAGSRSYFIPNLSSH